MVTRAPLAGLIVAGLLIGLRPGALVAAEPRTPSLTLRAPFPADARTGAADLLVVSEDEPWSIALAAPVAARFRRGDSVPLVVALSEVPTRGGLAHWAGPTPAAGGAGARAADAVGARPGEARAGGGDDWIAGPEASLRVARRFWKRCRAAVVAPADDAEAIILGSALAAGRGVPLILRDRRDSGEAAAAALAELGVRRVWIALRDKAADGAWAELPGLETELLRSWAVAATELVVSLGPRRSTT